MSRIKATYKFQAIKYVNPSAPTVQSLVLLRVTADCHSAEAASRWCAGMSAPAGAEAATQASCWVDGGVGTRAGMRRRPASNAYACIERGRAVTPSVLPPVRFGRHVGLRRQRTRATYRPAHASRTLILQFAMKLFLALALAVLVAANEDCACIDGQCNNNKCVGCNMQSAEGGYCFNDVDKDSCVAWGKPYVACYLDSPDTPTEGPTAAPTEEPATKAATALATSTRTAVSHGASPMWRATLMAPRPSRARPLRWLLATHPPRSPA
ncbi:hypothetical protein SDRG_06002 [Saprolegnia diclina VS20]|uniref:Uncharacterized protein n=1 Tax=Saprolegnia diclina (strain VS20) TaxID=1156394 RepID=T0QF59_SAPDV|nr:hypothetical protein SDRG_06002 [Saprolegnia diclina VS20]EQC36554.1 hypothetical protein SDRG_06002 [Saprolegnia diclina VS20]|eukprot:XP_008609975.1 hypothetical protein SDRG_06002 [Saprolegnia diclina VS20]